MFDRKLNRNGSSQRCVVYATEHNRFTGLSGVWDADVYRNVHSVAITTPDRVCSHFDRPTFPDSGSIN